MTREPRVDLVGTVAQVTRSLSLSSVGTSRVVEEVLGNDAVIVARILDSAGDACTLYVINPTMADLVVLQKNIPSVKIVPVGEEEATAVTTSTCVEDSRGRRSWTLSRTPALHDAIPALVAHRIYVDLYQEFDGAWMDLVVQPAAFVLANLSQRSVESLPAKLPSRVNLVQLSSPQQEVDCAVALSAEASRRYRCAAIATLGRGGAVLTDPAAGGISRFFPTTPVGKIDPLGVGAVFSAGLLLAQAETMEDVMHQAMQFVNSWLGGISNVSLRGA